MPDKELRIGDSSGGDIPNPDLRIAIDGSDNVIVEVPDGTFGDGTEDIDFASYIADVLTFDDTATSPTTNGEIRLNGTAIEAQSGGSVVSFSDIRTAEDVEDIVGALVVGGTDISATYDDGAGTLTLDYTGTGGGVDVEDDGTVVVSGASAINAGTDIEAVDDGDGTVTFNVTGGGTSGADDSRVQMFARRGVSA